MAMKKSITFRDLNSPLTEYSSKLLSQPVTDGLGDGLTEGGLGDGLTQAGLQYGL